MPRIRDYSTPQISATSPRIPETGNAGAAGVWGQVANLGESVAGLGQAINRRMAQDEQSRLNRQFAEARSQWAQTLDDEINQGTIDQQKVSERLQESINNLNQDISTREGRQFFENQAAMLNEYVLKNASKGAAFVAGKKAVENVETMMNLDAQLLQRRPGDFEDVYKQAVAFIENDEGVQNLSFDDRAKIKSGIGNEYAKNALLSRLRKNPYDVRKELDSGAWDKYLDANTSRAIRNQIDSELRQRDVQFGKLNNLKTKDGWRFLAETGELKNFRPLSLDASAGESFKQRLQFREEMQSKHGITLPLMPEREAEVLAEQLMSLNPRDAVDRLKSVDALVDDNTKSEFASQLFPKEPALSAALMIASDSPGDSAKILAGMNLIRKGQTGEGRAIKQIPPQVLDLAFDIYMPPQALEDRRARRIGKQAIHAHLVKTMVDEGQTEFNVFDQDKFDESARAILGPAVTINGQKTGSFRNDKGEFLDESDIESLVDSLTDEKVMKVQGDVPRTKTGEPMNLGKSRGRINLKMVGDGLYWVYRENQVAYQSDGRTPFELNLKGIANFKEGEGQRVGGMGFLDRLLSNIK